MATICLECRVATAVGPEMGHMGLPSLDETPRTGRRHRLSSKLSSGGEADTDETFGCLYSGLEAIGLFTHAIEAYRDFLTEHSGEGHRLYGWAEEHEELPGDWAGMEYSYAPYKPPRRAPSGFVEARVRFSCKRCGEEYQSRATEWVRQFEARTLTKESVRVFRRRTVGPSELNIHEAWPFDITLFHDFDDWLQRHARHTLAIELVREETRKRGVARRPGRKEQGGPALVAPEPWTPPAVPPEEDERLLGTVPDEALPVLAGLHHHAAAVRSESARALGRRAEKGTLAYLVPLLDDPAENVRVEAVRAIARLPDSRKVRPLGVALLDESGAVRRAGRRALRREGIGHAEALERARSPRGPTDEGQHRAGEKAGAPDRLRQILKDAVHPRFYSRADAATKLRRKGDERVLQMVLALLTDYSDSVANEAAAAAGALKAREAVEPLLASAARLPNEGFSRSREKIVNALGKIGDPRATPLLFRALSDKETSVRAEAVEALAGMEGDAVTKGLTKALKAKEEDVRRAAARLLGERGDKTAVPALVTALGDERYYVRSAAAEALVRIGNPKGLRAVLTAAAGGDAYVARRTHEYLIGEGDPRTEDALVEAVRYDYGGGDGKAAATRYVLSGNAKLVSAGTAALHGGRPQPHVVAVLWGSKRER